MILRIHYNIPVPSLNGKTKEAAKAKKETLPFSCAIPSLKRSRHAERLLTVLRLKGHSTIFLLLFLA